MKRVLVAVIFAAIGFLVSSIGYAAWQKYDNAVAAGGPSRLSPAAGLYGFELTRRAEGYTAKVIFPGGRPVKGMNRVRIEIFDAASRPVDDARLEIEYFMPSLPGKRPMMDYHAQADRVGDAYEATLKLDMIGEWKIVPSIKRADRAERATMQFVII